MDNIEVAEVLAAIHIREVRGLVTEMNMFKAMWMRHSILMPIEMCTKSSLIMIVQRTILNSLMNYKWNTMWTHAPFWTLHPNGSQQTREIIFMTHHLLWKHVWRVGKKRTNRLRGCYSKIRLRCSMHTIFFVEHNKKYKSIKSNFDRLVMSCVCDAYLWSVWAICSKKHNLWKITTCKGPHTYSSL